MYGLVIRTMEKTIKDQKRTIKALAKFARLLARENRKLRKQIDGVLSRTERVRL